MVFLFSILCNGLFTVKLLSISLRNSLPMLVFSEAQYGGLNQIIFLRLLVELVPLFCVGLKVKHAHLHLKIMKLSTVTVFCFVFNFSRSIGDISSAAAPHVRHPTPPLAPCVTSSTECHVTCGCPAECGGHGQYMSQVSLQDWLLSLRSHMHRAAVPQLHTARLPQTIRRQSSPQSDHALLVNIAALVLTLSVTVCHIQF